MNYFIWAFFGSLLVGQLPSLFGFHIYTHDIVLVLLFFAYFIFRKRKPVWPKLTVPILAFAAISLFTGGDFLYVFRWMGYTFIYFLVIQKIVPLNSWKRGLKFAGIGFAVLGIFQFFLYPDFRNLFHLGWDPYYYRLASTLFDPNFTGVILVLTILLGFKYDYLLLPVLLLTFSRSSFLALVVGLLMQKRQKMLVGFLILLAGFLLIPKPQFEAFKLTREVSTIARVNNWQQSFELFTKSPIFGWGARARSGIDNSFLFVLASTGLVGFSAFVWLWWGKIRMPAVAAVFVSSLFVNSLFYPWVMIWLWILIGVAEVEETNL